MTKNRILGLLILTVCALNIYGQEATEIPRREYIALVSDAGEKGGDLDRRITYRQENFSAADASLKQTTTTLLELVGRNKTRSLTTEVVGGVTTITEVITIGKIEYRRTGNGKWKKKILGEESDTIGTLGGMTAKVNFKNTVADAVLNNQPTRLYEELMIIEEPLTVEASPKANFGREKVWINKEGFILKREDTYGLLNPERIETRIVTEFEYRPKDLKIVAPIK